MHELHETRPLLAEAVLDRDAHVVEEQLRRVLGVHADLVEVAATLEPVHAALEHEQRHAAVALRRIGLDGGHDDVGVDPVRDERLGAVDDVVVAVADGGGRHRRQVGADARLGHRDRRDQLAGADAGQPPLLLIVVREVQEVGQADVVVQRQPEAGGVDVGPLQLLGDDDVEAEVLDAPAAELLGHLHAEEAVGPGDAEQLAVDDPGGLPLGVVRHGLALEERAERRPELVVDVLEERAPHRSERREVTPGASGPTAAGLSAWPAPSRRSTYERGHGPPAPVGRRRLSRPQRTPRRDVSPMRAAAWRP